MCSRVFFLVTALAFHTGCQPALTSQPTTSLPSVPARPAFDPAPAQTNGEVAFGDLRSARGTSASTPLSAGASTPLPAVETTITEKLELEAQFALEVDDVGTAAASVLRLVRQNGGRVQKEERSSTGRSQAVLVVRVPSEKFDDFTSTLANVGEIRNRRIKAVDATLEHRDVELVVKNLEAALARYRALTEHATEPAQVLALERELERVRMQLDRVKGRLDWLRDRVAYATIAVALNSPQAEEDVTPGTKAILSTALRGVSFVDVRESGTNGYLGGGLSARLPQSTGDSGRGFVLDVDVLRACCKARPQRSEWAYNVLVGIDLYSQAFQSGRRRWFNPYLGVRAGYSQTQNRGDFAAGAVLGLEIVKTRAFVADLQARVLTLVGNPDGPHVGITPALGVDLGF